MWARQDTSRAGSHIGKTFGAQSNNSWQLQSSQSNPTNALSFTTQQSGHLYMYSPDGAIRVATWQHLAATWDGAIKRLYVDGALATEMAQPAPIDYDQSGVTIGCDDNTPLASFYTGALDEVQLYDQALDVAQIQALARL